MRRSAIHHRQLALGGRLAQQAGWEYVASFGNAEDELRRARSGVVVVDLSPRGKLLVRGTGVEAWAARAVGGKTVPVGHVVPWDHVRGGQLCRLSQEDALVLTAPDETLPPRIAPALERSIVAEDKGCLHLVDVTSGRAGMGLVGPRSRDVLVKLTALDVEPECLPDSHCAQTALAKVAALVVRQDLDGGVPAYEVYVARDLGEYVWEAVLDAGAEFGIAPCGWTAYGRLRARSAAA